MLTLVKFHTIDDKFTAISKIMKTIRQKLQMLNKQSLKLINIFFK